RQSETKFFKLFDTSPIWMVLATVAEGRYIEANQAFYEITGFSPEEVKGRTAIEIGLWVKPAARSQVREILKEKGRLASLPIKFRMKNGEIRDFLWSAAVIDFAGELCALSGIIDITERKQAEKALVSSEKRFRDLAELLPETIFEIDIDGKLTFANHQAFDQFLYSQQDFDRGFNGLNLLAPEDRRRAAEDTAKILDGQLLGLLEYTALRKDGSTFPVLVHSTVIYHQNRAAGLRGFMIDVSEKKRLEAQLQQAQKLESLGTLAGGIAHDFNNLLMGIQGRTSLMNIDTPSFHPHHEHLREIENYVISAAELTKQLLGFARGGKYEVKPTDLNQLIAQSSRMFGRTKKEITIHRKFQKDLWTVEVDQGQIDQVLLNIYVNAWQAMPQGGELYIQTENVFLDANFVRPHDVRPGNYVRISVTDSGIGMDDATLKRVFDPFFTTKTKERGTGLGLASAYGIIQNHDGIITVDSIQGQGASFKIYLPSSNEAIPDEPDLSQELSGGSETVLIVDDEEMILSAGRGMLEKIGYSVLTAASGQQAVSVYDANRAEIDLVVLDVVMPDMSGGDTYDRLKKMNPAVKVLLSSGYSISGQAREILNRGCNGFIQKPFTMKAFSQKVREILEQRDNPKVHWGQ
ncbi:MAG: PAS domain S-box protein, partial [Desulfobacterales bacterium]